MADFSFYKYLEAAFRYKLKNNDATSFSYLGYKLPYETNGNNRGVFYYARNGKSSLPKIYTNFPNTKEGNLQMAKKVLENLDRHLDQQLDKYFNQTTTPNENVSAAGEAQAEQTAATQAGGIPPAGAPGMAGGMSSVPTIPSRSPHIIPQVTKEEATEKTGAPTEKQQTSQPKTTMPASAPSSSGKFNPSAFQSHISNFANKAQSFASPAGPLIKTNLNRVGEGLKNMFGNAANLGGRTGLSAINHGGNFLSNLSGSRSRLASGLKGVKSRVSSIEEAKKLSIGIGLFFMIFLVAALGGAISDTSTGEAAPVPPGTTPGAADISTCEFTRAGSSAKFQSPLLLSYIKEASQKSSIPPVVLAAFIRVESPSSSGMSDEQISDYSANCAQSPTGALGIMQIQPPGTTSAIGDPASCDDCIDAGAKLVGKTVATMTRADYCDPRTNIIVGAGWILKKMSQLNLGDGTKWDPAWTNDTNAIKTLVNTYYGCLNYGGATDCTGPYNYATDVSTSIQNCQQTTPPYQPGAGKGIISCPLNGTPTITNGSEGAGGHCSRAYVQDYGTCAKLGDADYTGKEKAIDITSSDRQVYLPLINKSSVTWTIGSVDTNTNYTKNGATVNGGYSVRASATSSGKVYTIRFVHIASTSLQENQQATSGISVGPYRTEEAHVHITIQENDVFQPADLYFNLCK